MGAAIMKQQTALNYPDTWTESTVNTYERLASMGKVDQMEVDRVESVLEWFRNVRDEFATKRVNGTTRQ
jgi:hypothetical protein